ncbi:MAG: AraC family transcriptional regulator [Ruminococcaceae bacterium]|nr:AraC family transcriptional regulator [Oscillospiraceae bacterium]
MRYNSLGDCMANLLTVGNSNFSFSSSLDEKPDKSMFKMHTHDTYEIFLFLEGKAVYYVEGNDYPLKRGDLLIMRRDESHYISIDESHPYKRYVIHFKKETVDLIDPKGELLKPFENRESGKFNLYRKEDFLSEAYLLLFEKINRCEGNPELTLLTNFYPLLNEIFIAFENRLDFNARCKESLSRSIINFINTKLTGEICLDDICNRFFISKASLCRIFKNTTGTTVWEYITIKRLTIAHRMIESGISANEAALQSGFSDYSVFYRAFKKTYGISPKNAFRQHF